MTARVAIGAFARAGAPLLCVCALALAVLSGAAAADSLEAIFKRANTAFFQGEFAEASEGYETLVAAGVRDPDVFYNQGLAYARGGQLGRAILAFERAALLSPGDDEIDHALGQAREAVAKRLADQRGEATVRTRPPVREALVRPFAENVLAWLLLLCNAALFGSLIARRFVRGESLRLGLAVTAAILAVATGLSGFGLWVKTGAGRAGEAAIVTAPQTPLREGPDAAAKERGEVGEGTLCRVLAREGQWARIRVQGGPDGWVKDDRVGTLHLD